MNGKGIVLDKDEIVKIGYEYILFGMEQFL